MACANGFIQLLDAARARAPLALGLWACIPVQGGKSDEPELFTPLGAAIMGGCTEAVEWLLAHGGGGSGLVNAPCALMRGEEEMLLAPLALGAFCARSAIQTLLAAGADADGRCPRTGWSALELLLAHNNTSGGLGAGAEGVEDLALSLLAHGASPACKRLLHSTNEGRAIDYAGRKGYAHLFRALIDAGSSVQPWALTVSTDCPAPANLVRVKTIKLNETLTYADLAAERGHADVLRAAIAAGLSPNHRSPLSLKEPLLCTAANYITRGQLETVTVLLDGGADVNAIFVDSQPSAGSAGFFASRSVPTGEKYDLCIDMLYTACDATALDIALGRTLRGSRRLNPPLERLLRARGAKTAVELGGRPHFEITF
jgi:hypothetical protein